MTDDRIRPESARDIAQFSALLRSLKRKSGHTLRELEEQAASQGAALPRSTIGDMLRRGALPRPELLAVFVRVCGDGEHLSEWLSARERLAIGPNLDREQAAPAAEPVAPGTGRRTWVIVAVLMVAAAAVVGVVWWPRTGPGNEPASVSSNVPVLSLPSAGSWVRMRAASAPELCLTDGREHTGRYRSAIAVLRPCGEPAGPRVFVQPVGTDLTMIKWEHPVDHSMGCLTVLESGVVKDMLEPQPNCVEGRPEQLFRIEQAGAHSYRLRTPNSNLCVGLRENLTSIDTEALREPCATEPDQEFLIDVSTDDRPSGQPH